ncbi:MAG: S41 family peptidase, partial [Planctomycetota bacterium]
MTPQGYYRFPTIHRDNVVFVSEDDLWTVPAAGGTARRLTSGLAEATNPVLSPDGKWIAYTGREEGNPEVHVMPAQGGSTLRLSFLGSTMAQTIGWSRDGKSVLFWSNGAQPMMRMTRIFAVDRSGGLAKRQPYGIARYISFGKKGVVIGRHGVDPARWKRYRGGTAGQLWIDPTGRGKFERLIETGGNLSHPMWVGGRIFFHSDHEGIGNIYSCTPDGKGLRRHTNHSDFYVRHPSSDGRRIVYQCGADLYVFHPRGGRSKKIAVKFLSPRTQRNRKFVNPFRFFEDYRPHPRGHSVALTARGRVFTTANWEGAVAQHGKADGARYRFGCWLRDGKRVVATTDEGGEETLTVFTADGSKAPKSLGKLSVGRPILMEASPKGDHLAVTNHRFELVLVDLAKRRARVLDRSRYSRIAGVAWSPDGRWIAYGLAETPHRTVLRLCNVAKGTKKTVSRAVLSDVGPSFDPDGK